MSDGEACSPRYAKKHRQRHEELEQARDSASVEDWLMAHMIAASVLVRFEVDLRRLIVSHRART